MPQPNPYYLTTAIDYPNSRPHIGTAFEKIGADVQARFRRMQGFDVHFQMGNDENTVKVSHKAEELGLDPKPYVDDMARQFRDVWDALEISYDDFIQTSEERHYKGCQKFIQAVNDAGHIEKRAYSALYCTGCEEFKTERDLVAGKCAIHAEIELKTVEEENYFFKLSTFQEKLLAHYEAHPGFIQPESRKNEIVSLVRSGLHDVSISRKGFTWGIPVPFDPEQTIYVWFDALLNYITALGYGSDDESPFEKFWPADVHVIGKDITRFHCALWPAMLMAADIPLPRQVFGHGFVYRKNESTGEIQKLSKSLGNAVEPMDLIRTFSAEAFRYYFMSQCPFGGDGEFSFDRFAEIYNADLANNLGNLYSRTLTMCVKYFDGRLEGADLSDSARLAWCRELDLPRTIGEIADLVGSYRYNVALERIWLEILDSANRYVTSTAPFKLIKTDPEGTRQVLACAADTLRVVAILLKPFLPRTAETFYRAFNFEAHKPWNRVRLEDALTLSAAPALEVTASLVDGKPAPLFPKIDPGKAHSP
jgi:methionyl-tRNA synthetase